MSMSTKIVDLPGSIPEEVKRDLNNIRRDESVNMMSDLDRQVQQNTIINSQMRGDLYNNERDIYTTVPDDTNVQMNIKKRVKFEDQVQDEPVGILGVIQNEINEENLLLYMVLIVASRSDMDMYIQTTLRLGDSVFLTVLVRCFILLIIYIITHRLIFSKN